MTRATIKAIAKNTLYLCAVEHQRKGFIYLHNVLELFPTALEEKTLSKHLLKNKKDIRTGMEV